MSDEVTQLEFNHFPKIHAMGTRHVREIFSDEVEVTEKVDGSQFAFGVFKGELKMRSKGRILINDAPDSMFAQAAENIIHRCDQGMIPEEYIFYGEYLNKPKHNTLKYDRVPKGNIALFGVYNPHNGTWCEEHKVLKTHADQMLLDVVPLIYKGKISSPEAVLGFMDRESMLGGCKIEGVVMKNYNKPYMMGGQEVTVMAAKYVSEAFKEVHRKSCNKENTGKGKFDDFKETFRSEARWAKAVQRLAELDQLDESPKDIGAIIKNIQNDIEEEETEYIMRKLYSFHKNDIEEEETEYIMRKLYSFHKNDIMRVATRGFPEWYKEQLLQKSFEGEKAFQAEKALENAEEEEAPDQGQKV